MAGMCNRVLVVGIGANDKIQVAYGWSLQRLGLHYGAESSATVISLQQYKETEQ